jgi:hypothetical protein
MASNKNHSLLNYDANGFGIDATLRWGLSMEKLELIAVQYQNENTHLLNGVPIE